MWKSWKPFKLVQVSSFLLQKNTSKESFPIFFLSLHSFPVNPVLQMILPLSLNLCWPTPLLLPAFCPNDKRRGGKKKSWRSDTSRHGISWRLLFCHANKPCLHLIGRNAQSSKEGLCANDDIKSNLHWSSERSVRTTINNRCWTSMDLRGYINNQQ